MSNTADSTVPSAGGDASEQNTPAQQKASDSQTGSHNESVQGSKVPSVTDTFNSPFQGADKEIAGSAQSADSTEQTSKEKLTKFLGHTDRALSFKSPSVHIDANATRDGHVSFPIEMALWIPHSADSTDKTDTSPRH